MNNKKIIAIAIILLLLVVGFFLYINRDSDKELQTINENRIYEETAVLEEQVTDVETDSLISNNTDIDSAIVDTEIEATDNKEEPIFTEEKITYDEEQTLIEEKEVVEEQPVQPEVKEVVKEEQPEMKEGISEKLTDEQIQALVERLENEDLSCEQIIETKKQLAKEEKALIMSKSKEQNGEPIEVEETEQKPSRDENGFIYTKEEVIEIFRTEYQKLMDTNDFNYTNALNYAIEIGNSTQEEFEADLEQLFTNPYSSEKMSRAFDEYRRLGDIGVLIGKASLWLMCGGDDGNYTDCVTQ